MSALLPFVRLAALFPFAESFSRNSGDALAFVRDYAHQAGYRLGREGEWIAEHAPERSLKRAEA
ncbi:MAG TPA: hypothetical protein VLX85_16310 [Stellaceae bacterium]|nr:hypothetical protein [Stellaceae bacterium]